LIKGHFQIDIIWDFSVGQEIIETPTWFHLKHCPKLIISNKLQLPYFNYILIPNPFISSHLLPQHFNPYQ
jgi:hypothetical protein